MKYFDAFSGYGGFSLGIKQAYELLYNAVGNEAKGNPDATPNMSDDPVDVLQTGGQRPVCVGYSEIDKYACQIYQKHFRQPRTKEEIENDLVLTKTIVSENNYDIMDICYVNTAKKETSFIKTTALNVKAVLEDTSFLGVKEILKRAGKQGENIMLCEDSECSICMGEDVSVVENLKKCSLPLNIKTEMDTLKENNMELAICINSPLKNIDQTDMKSFATTVITLKENIIYAHIKKTKPHRNFGDITKINAEELPDFDLFVGGFPCQAFSIAGKRKGFDDTRGTLFFDIARILRAKRPRLLLLENVKGLLSHDNGKTFSTIISTLDEIGYDLQWQVLNAKHFGVPQNRERVFIIGHLRGTSRPEVFPIRESNPKNLEQIVGGGQANRVYSSDGVACTQASQAGGQGAKTGLYAVALQNNRKIATKNETCNTLTSTFRGSPDGDGRPAIINGSKIRRLTPTECERLMGLPDGWTEGVSDTQRYKLCGNGVVVNVVEEIIKRLTILSKDYIC